MSVCAKLRFVVFYGFNNRELGPKNQLLRFQNRVTIQIVIWNRMYRLPFLHFANFSPFSSHTLLQAIVSIQRYSYRASHIGFKSVASIEVTLAALLLFQVISCSISFTTWKIVIWKCSFTFIWWLVRFSVVSMRRQLWHDDCNIKHYLYVYFILILHKFIEKWLRKKLFCEMVCTSLYGRVSIACAIHNISLIITKYNKYTSTFFLFYNISYRNGGDIIENVFENVLWNV